MAWSLGYCVYCTALALSTEILRPGGAHKQGGPYEGDGSGVHCGCNNCLHHVFVVVREELTLHVSPMMQRQTHSA